MSGMISLDAAWSLQKAVFETLTNSADLQAQIGTPARIYDRVPDDKTFPYVTFSDQRVSDWPGIIGGVEHDLRLQAWSRYGGQFEVKQIMSCIYAALHHADLTLENTQLVNLRFAFSDSWRRRDTEIWQGVMRFRALTQPLSIFSS